MPFNIAVRLPTLLVALAFAMLPVAAATPPAPSASSQVGDLISVPDGKGGTTTATVTALIKNNDPSLPNVGSQKTAFVEADDGYAYMVLAVGDQFWTKDPTPGNPDQNKSDQFVVKSIDAINNQYTIDQLNDNIDNNARNQPIRFLIPYETPGQKEDQKFIDLNDGITKVFQGANGGSGRTGVLVVPPTSGSPGKTPVDLTWTNTVAVVATQKVGVETGSIGGNGGKGGDSYVNIWSARPGGEGAKGGRVTFTNQASVETTGASNHALVVFSVSGTGGDGGDSTLAPGGADGGGSLSGGPISVVNGGRLITNGAAAHGIRAISRSGQGGQGGTLIGLLGQSGSGGAGSDGGQVTVDNTNDASITTYGNESIGIYASSVGGAGGDGGSNWGSFFSAAGMGQGGGSGGDVSVSNAGAIDTHGQNSAAITAQSFGGGGGSGGTSFGLFAIGGTGDGGGSAGAVTATNTGVLRTQQSRADGIVARSIAGSGGDGGDATGVLALGGTTNIAGSKPGTVTVVNQGLISTSQGLSPSSQADRSTPGGRGIVAQSIGGGGGDAGSARGLFTIGATGGGGGDGGKVSVLQAGTIETQGTDAIGLQAQSIGGGGGNGGSATSIAAFLGVAIGGQGKDGGQGGTVDVQLGSPAPATPGLISTNGDRAIGVFAQSIGGGGGNGGGSVAVTLGAGGAMSLAVGGRGGAGGTGGAVTLSQNANSSTATTTTGTNASALLLQSIGGGGGNGGYAIAPAVAAGPAAGSISLAIGGAGGVAGQGGAVRADYSGRISTTGDRALGLSAQSIGGGGGNGGYAIAASGAASKLASGALSLAIGGQGGSGGSGGPLAVTVQGDVSTEGAGSHGLAAQSIGGGGGNGGGSLAIGLAASPSAAASIAVGLGGDAGSGSRGGTVSLNASGKVATRGRDAAGLLLQSIGGGGGNGGYSIDAAISGAGGGSGAIAFGQGGSGGDAGHGDAVTLKASQVAVTTAGHNADAVVAQSIGGGGGRGSTSIAVSASGAGTGSLSVSGSLGGSGGAGGDGGAVDSTVEGTISTEGDQAIGLLAESVGGGGGKGGYSIAVPLSGAGTVSGAGGIAIGGSGAFGGSGGPVRSIYEGVLSTAGLLSPALLVQSVGGGGGVAGFNISAPISGAGTGSGAISLAIGGHGGAGGTGGAVSNTVRAGSTITTGQSGSGAVLAQSIGGGGGQGGLSVSGQVSLAATGSAALGLGLGGSGGDGGDSGTVSNSVSGRIQTRGHNSAGVAAQSVAGGGGTGDLSIAGTVTLANTGAGSLGVGLGGWGGLGGNAGAVDNTVDGQISTDGQQSPAVLSQSVGGGGGQGGIAITSGLTAALNGSTGAVALGIGGTGGDGGDGGGVTTTVNGTIKTNGSGSPGLVSQSVGGGGGSGGLSITGGVTVAAAATGQASELKLGIGGFGGSGGASGPVAVSSNASIEAAAAGLLAQSIAGGGGDGGINISGGLTYTGGGSASFGPTMGVGGFGGAGGDAAKVTVNVGTQGANPTIRASNGSSALVAQSVGGGGGNGAVNIAGGISTTAPMLFGVGGLGQAGGKGGDVDVQATAALTADASASDSNAAAGAGLLAQSVGGGGGNGGLNVSGGISLKQATTVLPALTLAVGGKGGSGATGGAVNVAHRGTIATAGSRISGLVASSVGGGGGQGGANVAGTLDWRTYTASDGSLDLSLRAALGGDGGLGADGGPVAVNQAGAITTQGDDAGGVLAQSIGGGGGKGGWSVSGSVLKNGSPLSLAVGGSGQAAGKAAAVRVDRPAQPGVSNAINTDGLGSVGLLAQSIGGGGGQAGFTGSLGLNLLNPSTTGKGLDASIVIGGSGGASGDGATVAVTNNGPISTRQNKSHGLAAQSVGGGGGNGNYSFVLSLNNPESIKPWTFNQSAALALTVGGQPGTGGQGDRVQVDQAGAIETQGADAIGLLAQSVGGGGGDVGLDLNIPLSDGFSADLTIGQQGGSGGSGGDVQVSHRGAVQTGGARSHGLLVQSVGGGGGKSSATSFAVSGATTTNDKVPPSFKLSLGLQGGQGGSGGAVNLRTEPGDAAVRTSGADALGIVAQSIGGGGGAGGMALGAGASAPTVAIALGGQGGNGGVGGPVNLSNGASVTTQAGAAMALLAQSVGGGGGLGGMSFGGGGWKSPQNSWSLALGGAGGPGVDGGTVAVSNQAVLQTSGSRAHGLVAQSIGGGGGNGYLAATLNRDTTNPTAVRFEMTVGGQGGTGGSGSDVQVSNSGRISTGVGGDGIQAAGILAQSIGGGGGDSGLVSSLSWASQSNGFLVSMQIGNQGGSGGRGGNVTVQNTGNATIDTVGADAYGLSASSIGGGGGTANNTVALTKTSAGAKATTSAQLSIGGSGGNGGSAGTVSVTNNGQISTRGSRAHGVLAQSIGGGGGNGGLAIEVDGGPAGLINSKDTGNRALGLSLGGSGGSGGSAAPIAVTNAGRIEVFGHGAYGIQAQSIGGGGGNGAFKTIFERADGTPVGEVQPSQWSIAIGGAGGQGGTSGDVTVSNNGSIVAHGDHAYGIHAQSISGGGGAGSQAISGLAGMGSGLQVNRILGKQWTNVNDGPDGTPGKVTVTSNGTVTMLGRNSTPQLAQSINGGGGNGQLAIDLSQKAGDGLSADTMALSTRLGADASTAPPGASTMAASSVEADHTGTLQTGQAQSIGSLIQSIGGGGGQQIDALAVNQGAVIDQTITLGSLALGQSSAGPITLRRTGNVITAGDQSQGVAVQAIGGGGGRHASAITTTTAPGAQAGQATEVNAVVTLGADTSADNHGQPLAITLAGDVSTGGAQAPALVLQSIGAGGGQALLSGLTKATVAVGGAQGSSGDGGAINLQNTGSVITTGQRSDGIVLQSIGGGGGYLLTDLSSDRIAVTARQGNQGSGKAVSLTQTGDVVVSAPRSTAITLQSLGGGGGKIDHNLLVGSAGGQGDAGPITLKLKGSVKALGPTSVGVLAQSQAGVGGQQDALDLTVQPESLIAVAADGVAIKMMGGTSNILTNHGSITAATAQGGPDGDVTTAEAGDDTVNNQAGARFYGNLRLGAGTNRLINHKATQNLAAGLAIPGTTIDLGSNSNSEFLNSGVLAPGGTALYTTALSGNFNQDKDGIYQATLDYEQDLMDRLDVTQTASLQGTLEVNPTKIEKVKPGQRSIPFLKAEQGFTKTELSLDIPRSVFARYSLGYQSAGIKQGEGVLNVDVNFSPAGNGLTGNQRAIGNTINAIQRAGSSPALAPLIQGLFALQTIEQAKAAYSSLSPEPYLAAQAALQSGSQQTIHSLFSCKQLTGRFKFISEGQCAWLDSNVNTIKVQANNGYAGYTSNAADFSAGAQWKLANQWFAGLTLGRNLININHNDGLNSQLNGGTTNAGLSLKKVIGGTKVGVALATGFGEITTQRSRVFPTNATSTGTQSAAWLATSIRAAHELKLNKSTYLMPSIDLSYAYNSVSSVQERGAGAIGLRINGSDQSSIGVSPGLEIGGQLKAGEVLIRPRIGIGYTGWFATNALVNSAQFLGAPAGVSNFKTTSGFDSNYLDLSAGVDMLFNSGVVLRLHYVNQQSVNTVANRAEIKVSIPF